MARKKNREWLKRNSSETKGKRVLVSKNKRERRGKSGDAFVAEPKI